MPNKTGPQYGLHGGKLEVVCWCGKKIKKFTAAEVRAGVTFSCGPGCHRGLEK